MCFFSRSLQHGWERTLPAAMAPLVTDGPIILLVTDIAYPASPSLLNGLQITGVLFILYTLNKPLLKK